MLQTHWMALLAAVDELAQPTPPPPTSYTSIPVTTDLRVHWDFGRAINGSYTGSGTLNFTDNIPGDGLDALNGGGCNYWNRNAYSTVDIVQDPALGVNYAKIYRASNSNYVGTCLTTEDGALTHDSNALPRSGFTYVTCFKRVSTHSSWMSPIHWDVLKSNLVAVPTSTSYRGTGYLHFNQTSNSSTPLLVSKNGGTNYLGTTSTWHTKLNDPLNLKIVFSLTTVASSSGNLVLFVKFLTANSLGIQTKVLVPGSATIMDLYQDAPVNRRIGFIGDNMYWNGGPEWHWYEHAYYERSKTEAEIDSIMNYMATKYSII